MLGSSSRSSGFVAVLAFLVLHLTCATGQNPKDYDDLIKVVAKDKLKSSSVIPFAESALVSATNDNMRLTAKLFLAQGLANRGYDEIKTNDMARARQLWAEVMKEGNGTWQVAFARFNTIAEVGHWGHGTLGSDPEISNKDMKTHRVP